MNKAKKIIDKIFEDSGRTHCIFPDPRNRDKNGNIIYPKTDEEKQQEFIDNIRKTINKAKE